MTSIPANRLQVTIIGGFLGSGKTTWLRHQLYHGRMAEALIIVNEAASVPVDGAILSGISRVIVLAGGCACCEGRAKFVALLRDIANSRTCGQTNTPDHIVVEASGLADPSALIEAMRSDSVLIHHIRVKEIIIVVDGRNGLAQLRDEPLARSQIEAADRLVITKTDTVDERQLRQLVSLLYRMNPGPERSGSDMGSETKLPVPDASLVDDYALSNDDTRPIIASKLDLGPDANWNDFSVWLSALLHARGDEIVRVKGVVRTPAGRLLLQSVRRSVQPPEILPEQEFSVADDNIIAVIGRGFVPDDLPRSLFHFTAKP